MKKYWKGMVIGFAFILYFSSMIILDARDGSKNLGQGVTLGEYESFFLPIHSSHINFEPVKEVQSNSNRVVEVLSKSKRERVFVTSYDANN